MQAEESIFPEASAREVHEDFPTRVGMNRPSAPRRQVTRRLPHARGDEPINSRRARDGNTTSPRAWG